MNKVEMQRCRDMIAMHADGLHRVRHRLPLTWSAENMVRNHGTEKYIEHAEQRIAYWTERLLAGGK